MSGKDKKEDEVVVEHQRVLLDTGRISYKIGLKSGEALEFTLEVKPFIKNLSIGDIGSNESSIIDAFNKNLDLFKVSDKCTVVVDAIEYICETSRVITKIPYDLIRTTTKKDTTYELLGFDEDND